jgi:hypothetical protein
MSRQQVSHTWPFFLVLAVLFYFCITAPRGWREIARERPSQIAMAPLPKRTTPVAPKRELATIVPALPASPKPLLVEPHPMIASQKSEPAVHEQHDVAMRPSPNLSLPDWLPPETSSSPVVRPSDGASQHDPSAPKDETSTSTAPVVKGSLPQPSRPQLAWSPDSLLARLDRLSSQSECEDWVKLVIDSLHSLTNAANPAQADTAIRDLRAKSHDADRLLAQLATQVEKRPLVTEIRRVQHALVRRLDLWELIPTPQIVAAPTENGPDPARLGLCLAEAVEFFQQGDDFDGWREYLLLDSLKELTTAQTSAGSESQKQRELARLALEHLQSGQLNSEQQEYLSADSIARLSAELQNWIAGPVNCQSMLISLEKFEQSGLPSDARQIALYAKRLAASDDESARNLAEKLDANYRLANLRIAVSADLLNRLMPPQPSRRGAIRERVLGVPTQGWSETSTQLAMRLIPDPNRLRFALVADGQVSASTSSTSGPATLLGQSESIYTAEKMIQFGPEGIMVLPAEADADCTPELNEVRTNFDGIPFLGGIVKSIARNEHASSRGEIRHEMRRKISARVQSQVDANIDPRLAKVNRLLKDRFISPLNNLELKPLFASLQTTAERASMRVRLAGDEQLAANTPRPAAPGDSLISMQIHESLLNNLIERLDLDGHTFTPAELQAHISNKLNLKLAPLPETIPQDVTLTLAPQNALRLHCEEGLIGMSLSVADLARGNEHWRDFVVKVHYRPEMAGLDAWLSRDGVIQLAGPRLNVKAQIALRGIFSKLFPPDRRVPLIHEEVLKHPKLAHLQVSQFVVAEGWLGIAVSPPRGSPTQNVVRLPTTSSVTE